MSLVLLGISHHSAPIEERERLTLPEAGLRPALAELARVPGVAEGLILSTCNRVELLVEGSDTIEAASLFACLVRVTAPRPHHRPTCFMNCAEPPPPGMSCASLRVSTRWWWASRRFWVN